jgi:paraquat-inducible protein A
MYRSFRGDIDLPIALAVSALVLFILANAYPLIAVDANGTTRTATLLGAALALYGQGYAALAALVLTTTVLVPLSQILTYLYVLVPLRRGRRAAAQDAVLRALTSLRPWAMVEVFMLGALVALTKLAESATVLPHIALISYGLLMFTLAALLALTPAEQLWQWVERSRR